MGRIPVVEGPLERRFEKVAAVKPRNRERVRARHTGWACSRMSPRLAGRHTLVGTVRPGRRANRSIRRANGFADSDERRHRCDRNHDRSDHRGSTWGRFAWQYRSHDKAGGLVRRRRYGRAGWAFRGTDPIPDGDPNDRDREDRQKASEAVHLVYPNERCGPMCANHGLRRHPSIWRHSSVLERTSADLSKPSWASIHRTRRGRLILLGQTLQPQSIDTSRFRVPMVAETRHRTRARPNARCHVNVVRRQCPRRVSERVTERAFSPANPGSPERRWEGTHSHCRACAVPTEYEREPSANGSDAKPSRTK